MKVHRILIALLIGVALSAFSEFLALPWEVTAVVSGAVAGAVCLSLLDAAMASLIVSVVVYVTPLLLRTSSSQGTELLAIVSSVAGFSSVVLIGLASVMFVIVAVLSSLAVNSAVSFARKG